MFQQRKSAVFRNDVDDTYDAYEKDIAIASFYFEEPTAYEYTRYAIPNYYTLLLISYNF